jgi:predicted RNA binding protein with dsRBD fold (UPF0201 family)
MIIRKTLFVIIVVQMIYLVLGCKSPAGNVVSDDLGRTIGSLVDVIYPESVAVEGYGLIAGLHGTGSSECPPQIRTYLTQYILAQLSSNTKTAADELINSLNTAVVLVEAQMPVLDAKGKYFDVKVSALPGTQTTSLNNGWLFPTELKVKGSFGVTTEVLADAEGPIFQDKIGPVPPDPRTGYVLAGGKNLTEYKIGLVLKKADFKLTNEIRNLLNERFGRDVARAVLAGRIEVTIPAKFQQHRREFISIIMAMYMTETPELTLKRIDHFVRQLTSSQDSQESEIALEAIGNQSLAELAGLLNASDERVRLRAARCMLSLGSDAGLPVLRQIVMNKRSAYRSEALESIFTFARPNDAANIARSLLNDDDFNVRLSAYELLRGLNDLAITREAIGKNFFLEQISRSEQKIIYVSRSGQPKIVLFGAPIYCNRGIFIESPDKEITINAPVDQEYVLIIRAHPNRPGVIGQMKCTFDLGDVIQRLCTEPAVEAEKGPGGLGVSCSDTIALLKQMCDKGAINAEFRAGPLPKIGLNVKK